MENLIIRKAVPEDVKIIFQLINELAVYEKLSSEVTADEKTLLNSLFGEKKYAEVLIAEYKNEIAGQALFFHNFSTFVGKPGVYLEDIYVRPHLRAKGIGKELLLEIIKIAKERDCGRVEWCVLDWNKSAIDFYESLGAVHMKGWQIFRLTKDKF